jgi:hypothetical protein
MAQPDNTTRDAIEELWATVFGEAPSIRCDSRMLAEVLVRSLPPVPPYGDPPSLRDREPLPRTRPPSVDSGRAD